MERKRWRKEETTSLRSRAALGTAESAAKPINREVHVHSQAERKGSEELLLKNGLFWDV